MHFYRLGLSWTVGVPQGSSYSSLVPATLMFIAHLGRLSRPARQT